MPRIESSPSSIVNLSLRYYSYKTLLNANAYYHRGRFACVMLSHSLGYYVTACNGNTQELVMLLKEGWDLSALGATMSCPPLALAVDTCYSITFLSDDPTTTVRHVEQTLHSALRAEWNHATSQADVPSVTASPISTSASAAASASALASASWSPSLASDMAMDSPSQHPFDRWHTKVSCLSCRLAKAKCDNQRSVDLLPATRPYARAHPLLSSSCSALACAYVCVCVPQSLCAVCSHASHVCGCPTPTSTNTARAWRRRLDARDAPVDGEKGYSNSNSF